MATTEKKKSAGKLTINNVRLSFVHVLEPSRMQDAPNSQLKYSVSILIPKNHPQLEEIKKTMQIVAEEGKATWGGKIPANLTYPLRDGEEKAEKNPEYAGHFFMNATSNSKPGLVDRKLQAIIDPAEVYSGMYGNVNVNFFTYNKAGNKGIGCGLNHIQKVKDGEPLSGRGTPEDEFEVLDDADDLTA